MYKIQYLDSYDRFSSRCLLDAHALVVKNQNSNSFIRILGDFKSYSGDLIILINGNEKSNIVIDTIFNNDLDEEIESYIVFDVVILKCPFRKYLHCSTLEEKSMYRTMTLIEIMDYLKSKFEEKELREL